MVKLFCRYMTIFLLVFGFGLTAVAAIAAEGPTVTGVTVQVGEIQSYSNAEVWPAYCEPDSTTCTLAGKDITLEALAKEMPVSTWGYCGGVFCYGDRSESDVIGLNPLYFR